MRASCGAVGNKADRRAGAVAAVVGVKTFKCLYLFGETDKDQQLIDMNAQRLQLGTLLLL